jgi:RNA polymerase sigma factor (sigma-70 family)
MSNLKNRVDFIQSRAEALAARYKSAQDYHDLIQEGVLVGLELLEQGVDDDKKIIGAMRRRMNDYINYSNRTVAIPSSGASRAAMATIQRGNPSNCEDSPLMQALMNSYAVSLEDCNLTTEDSHTQDYETQEFIQHVLLTMEECLDDKTYDVLSAVYLHGVTQEMVAQELGVTQQYVNQVLKFGLQKIKGELEK